MAAIDIAAAFLRIDIPIASTPLLLALMAPFSAYFFSMRYGPELG
jgi:hypothetical protein